jgi:hypothetical protein
MSLPVPLVPIPLPVEESWSLLTAAGYAAGKAPRCWCGAGVVLAVF